jgi:L-ornithine N5-oxygenase
VHAEVQFLPTGEVSTLEADVIVYATGYRERNPFDLLGEAAAHCQVGPGGGPVVERDYRIATDAGLGCGIYLQGATQGTHGIASSLLSMTAVRTGEIVQSIARRSARVLEGAQS